MEHSSKRRMLLAAMAAWCGNIQLAKGTTPEPVMAKADPARTLHFPRDHGSHPDFRIEWWYATGWLRNRAQHEIGFQVTFFRVKPQIKPGNPSAFNPEHIIIAHAAVADPRQRQLIHTQRAGRAVLELAGAAIDDTNVWLDDWFLTRRDNIYQTHIASTELALDLAFTPTQSLLLQGVNGYSRKGPGADAASHYYSLPQLQVSGTLRSGGVIEPVSGNAWLDHEWSSSYLSPDAAGWDWIGINLDDGSALMAFRMRKKGQASPLWFAATLRDSAGHIRHFGTGAVQFSELRSWQSPRTGTRYPVAFRVHVGNLEIVLEPLLDDQESDTRRTTGAVYWEGAVRASSNGRVIGRGYLELTGYGQPLKL